MVWVIIDLGPITFHLSHVSSYSVKSGKETDGTRDVSVPGEGEWVHWRLKKRRGSHSLSMLEGGEHEPDMQGELLCDHSNGQAPPPWLQSYNKNAP